MNITSPAVVSMPLVESDQSVCFCHTRRLVAGSIATILPPLRYSPIGRYLPVLVQAPLIRAAPKYTSWVRGLNEIAFQVAAPALPGVTRVVLSQKGVNRQ